jgi:hypothetical protein
MKSFLFFLRRSALIISFIVISRQSFLETLPLWKRNSLPIPSNSLRQVETLGPSVQSLKPSKALGSHCLFPGNIVLCFPKFPCKHSIASFHTAPYCIYSSEHIPYSTKNLVRDRVETLVLSTDSVSRTVRLHKAICIQYLTV